MKKIFLFLPGPFSRREYDRFGIEMLEKNFLVKTLDLTPWLFPKLHKMYFVKNFHFENNVTISSEEDLLNLLNNTHPDIVIDAIGYSKTKKIRKIIRNNGKSLFVDIFINSIPWPKINIKKNLKILIFKPNKFFHKLFKYISNKYYHLTKFKSDLGIVGGLFDINRAKKHSNELIYAHCNDYDIYLDIKDKPINKKNSYAVFVDQSNTYDFIIFNEKSPYDDEYYSLLVKFFNKFKKETKLPVIFAAHPKTPNHVIEKFPDLLKGIEYQIGNTAELIRNSNMVLLHHSTTFSFAVLFNKPTVFLTTNKLRNDWMGPRIDDFAKRANSQIINMDNDLNKPLDLQILSKIDKDKYKNYLGQHLKVPNSPDIPLWEIVTKYLKEAKKF